MLACPKTIRIACKAIPQNHNTIVTDKLRMTPVSWQGYSRKLYVACSISGVWPCFREDHFSINVLSSSTLIGLLK